MQEMKETKIWKNIIFPSDGDSVFAAGAVDGNNIIADFSSAGPSADGRIKPDNATMGVSVPVQISENISWPVKRNIIFLSCSKRNGSMSDAGSSTML